MTSSIKLMKDAYIQSLSDFPDGSFFDADYFERGKQSGKGWLENYRWMPERSFKEASAVKIALNLDKTSKVLDVGCAKGFLVKALREMNIKADGCDISEYALSFAPKGCWLCNDKRYWKRKRYTHAFCKDVLEHCTIKQLIVLLECIGKAAPIFMCVIPIGDGGQYRIQEYHTEITHLIAEDENWWRKMFKKTGWKVVKECSHVAGLKDNWQSFADGIGNRVFLLWREDAEHSFSDRRKVR